MTHKDKNQKFNCWEFKKCGREKGGANTADLGVCPASTETALHGVHDGTNSGRACWVMEGTLCAASVQGSFLEKFKKCITCDFFHLIEAQEGRDLKNAKDLLRIIEAGTVQEVSEKIKAKAHSVAVCQGCGQELGITISPNWKVNVVGLLEFQCKTCKTIVRTKGLLAAEAGTTVELNLN